MTSRKDRSMPRLQQGRRRGVPRGSIFGQVLDAGLATPTLYATRVGGQLETERCPACGAKHYHGVHTDPCKCGESCGCLRHPGRGRRLGAACTCPPGNGDGHRVAHCADLRRPRCAAGYYVTERGAES